MSNIASPCVRNCCLDPNDICCGCFRSIDEITGWAGRTEQEQLAILEKCEERKIEAEQKKSEALKQITQ